MAVKRYRYEASGLDPAGEFKFFNRTPQVFEEWQGGQRKYTFVFTSYDSKRRFYTAYDNTRNISIMLPDKDGMAKIKWAGTPDDSSPWQDFKVVKVLQKETMERRFQVNAGYTKVGKFTRTQVQNLKKTSCVLSLDLGGGTYYYYGSGTLIHNRVVLTAAHVLEDMRATHPNFLDTEIQVTFNWEYTQQTVNTKSPVPSPNRPWAKVKKVIEEGSKYNVDYALLLIEWVSPGLPNPVGTPAPIANRTPRLGENVLAVQHPPSPPKKGDFVFPPPGTSVRLYECPTQVSAGDVYDLFQAPFGDQACAYAFFYGDHGSSGGGVFDTNGQLLGVIGGGNEAEGMAFFVQMDKIVAKSARVRQFIHIGQQIPTWFPANLGFPAPILLEDLPFL